MHKRNGIPSKTANLFVAESAPAQAPLTKSGYSRYKPGWSIVSHYPLPVDGVVTSGSSSMSEADLTGEPVPVRKMAGMLVLSGSVNLDGVVEIRASKRSAESQYAQIVHLVEAAQAQKAPIHRLADRYSIVLTVVAVTLAGLAWALSKKPVYALAVMTSGKNYFLSVFLYKISE